MSQVGRCGCVTSRSQGEIRTVRKACGAAGPAGGYGSRVLGTPKQTQTHTSDRKPWAKQKLMDFKDEGSKASCEQKDKECVCM